MALLLELTPDPLRKVINKWRFEQFQKGRSLKKSSIAAFDYYQCIFVHIPKTGGISVNDALWGNPGGVHKTMGDYGRIFSRNTLDAYFKFTFVRNPFDRLVSAFTFMKAGGLHAADAKWASQHLEGFDDFEQFVRGWLTRDNIYKGLHFIPQTDFLKLEGKLVMDFIGRMENFEADFHHVKTKLGLPEASLPHKTDSGRKDYRGYYNDETAAIVANVYQQDLELLEYSFDGKLH